ncbi:hypothetical protein T484DRAFT_1859276, partial [Baffinella frigidus]
YEIVNNLAGAKEALTGDPPTANGFFWEKYEIVNNLAGAKEALTADPPTANGFLWEKFTTKPLALEP